MEDSSTIENSNDYLEPLDSIEEEEGTDDGVYLGFVDDPEQLDNLLRHYFPSKAGGVPAWMDPENLPNGDSRNCGFCGNPLQFLLQVYAPISEKDSTFHRTLFVFMCPSMSCLIRDQHEQSKPGEQRKTRSVKVFRCQLPLSNAFYSSKAHEKPLTSGVPLCSWCGTWKGDKVCSSCKGARYCSQEHQGMHWRSGHKNACHEMVSLHTSKPACTTLWHEYEILQEEYMPDTDSSEDVSSGMPHFPKDEKTDETDQFWMDKFEAGIDKKTWASFQERISKAPQQVLRYYRYSKGTPTPLWPLLDGRPSKADIPKCKYCLGSLCFEFQIMSQLLYFFGVQNHPDSLDWATIVVYTCDASCEGSLAYKEEFAWVQLFPLAHNS